MELVYLWVEEYKNIHKQGFNFSPRFTCDYDEETNELTIDENNDYIEKFFGDNINVTAIVGKNGSGKSSVLELITNYEDAKFFHERNFFLIYTKDENLYCIYFLPSVPDCNVRNIKFSHRDEFLKRFNDKDDNWNIRTYELSSSKPVSEFITYKRLDGSFHSTSTKNKNSYYLSDNQFFIHKYIDIYRNQKKVMQRLKTICMFDTLRLALKPRQITIFDSYDSDNENVKNIIDKTKNVMSKFSDEHRKLEDEFSHTQDVYNNYKRLLAPSLFIAIVDYFLNNACMETRDSRDECYLIFINMLDNLREQKQDIDEGIYTFLSKTEENIGHDKFKNGAKIFEAIKFLIGISNTIKKEDDTFYYDLDLKTASRDKIDLINIITTMFDDKQQIDIDESLRLFELDLINGETEAKYKTISDGEKQFLKITIDFFTQLPYVAEMTNNKSHIFLADEIDESLHPEWKKNIISHLVDILKIYTSGNKKINLHLIITTHSPFLISDIPKQNIIFLDKDEKGNCKVLKHDEVMNKKQTFGANIHTLLSDSFFMKDGLMGEFAKGKINEIIEFHKEVEKIKDDESARNTLRTKYEIEEDEKPSIKTKFWNIQSIIGEEYLKQVIKNHLVDIENILLGYDKAKEEEIKRLRDEANRLEKLS